jgi:tRNA A37 threonylcarbamoyladenosine dehydratase
MRKGFSMSKLHRFSRTELLIGKAGVSALQKTSVAVFGLGGVGSYAAEALCRAGIGRLTLVDFDDICLSNINRQLHAMDGTVGRIKCEVMAERLRLINPAAAIIPLKEFYTAENSGNLLGSGYDYVLDAIDHFTSKVHLLKSCRELGIPVISSMGAAMKLDPTLIRVADIAETHRCRMAKSVRKLLRKEGIESGISVVYSTEGFRAVTDAAPVKLDLPDGGEWQRRITLGSISFIPAIFGMTMAGVVVNDLLKKIMPVA